MDQVAVLEQEAVEPIYEGRVIRVTNSAAGSSVIPAMRTRLVSRSMTKRT